MFNPNTNQNQKNITFAFFNPICWLKKKIVQPNSNSKQLCDPLFTGGLVSQPNSPPVQPEFLVG